MNDYELPLNIILLAVCYAYVSVCIVLSGKTSKLLALSSKASRKLLHILIGNLPFFIPLFTLNTFPLNFPFFVAAPFMLVTFLASPYSPARTLSERLRKLTSITGSGHHLGLVYYAISYSLLALFFAHKPYVVAAGILPMAYGDASAAIVGEKYGNTKYWVFTKKSLEGSVAMFLASFLSLEVSSLFFSALYALPLLMLTLATLSIALVATLVEAISPKGFDNITVPILSALIFLLMTGGI
jgi:phytol kinase